MSFEMDDTTGIIYILQSLGPLAFSYLVCSKMLSFNHYYILGINLLAPLKDLPAANPKATPSLITREDIAYIRRNLDTFDPEDRRQILARLVFYERGFTNCYVMRHGDDVAYMQWIILPAENRLISEKYSARYSTLTERQVMIENAFTFPRYRGRGYFLRGTMYLLELAKNSGYSSAICYIRKDRIIPLNEFMQMGFRIIRLVREYKLLGRAWRTL